MWWTTENIIDFCRRVGHCVLVGGFILSSSLAAADASSQLQYDHGCCWGLKQCQNPCCATHGLFTFCDFSAPCAGLPEAQQWVIKSYNMEVTLTFERVLSNELRMLATVTRFGSVSWAKITVEEVPSVRLSSSIINSLNYLWLLYWLHYYSIVKINLTLSVGLLSVHAMFIDYRQLAHISDSQVYRRCLSQ